MRMLLLAGAVAVAVLAGVVVLGFRFVGDDDPKWAEHASAACERGLEESRGAVAATRSVAPVEQRALQLFTAATEIESTVLAELLTLRRPAADELAIRRALEIIAEAHDDDLVLVDRLRETFDAKLFEQRVNAAVPVSEDLRHRFESLGADGCVRYYDPASYGT
jgi:hypothetical protein